MITTGRIPNGTTILTETLPTAEFTCFMVWSGRGRFHETSTTAGATELLQQEILSTLVDWAIARGGCASGQVIEEASYHYLLVPPRLASEALQRLVDRYCQPPIDPDSFAQLKQQVYRQCRRRQNRIHLPQLIVQQQVSSNDSVAMDPVPSSEALSYEDYLDFRRQALNPKNLTVCHIGLGREQAMLQTLKNRFASLSVEGSRRESHLQPKRLHKLVIPYPHAAIGVGFPLVLKKFEDLVSMTVFANMLSMRHGHLVMPFFYPGRNFSYWLLLSRRFGDRSLFPWKEISREIKQIVCNQTVDPTWLAGAKNLTIKNFLEESAGILGRAYTLCYASQRDYYGNVDDYVAAVEKITTVGLQQFLQNHRNMTPEYVISGDDPKSMAQFLDTFTDFFLTQLPKEMDPINRLWVHRPSLSLAPKEETSQQRDSKALYRGAHVIRPNTTKPTRKIMANGMQLLLVPNTDSMLDFFGLYLKGGRIYESVDNCGITQLLFSSILASVQTQHSLSKRIEWLGGYIEADVTADISGIRGMILADHLPTALSQLTSSAFTPEVPGEDMLRWVKANLRERMRLRQDSLFHRSIDLFYRTLFGAHPYGLSRFGTAKSLTALTRDNLLSWHGNWVQPQKAVLVLATSRSSDEVVHMLPTQQSGSDKAGVSPPAEILSLTRHSKSGDVVEIDSDAEPLSAYVLGFAVPSAIERQWHCCVDVIQHALSAPGGLILAGREQGLFSRAQAFYVPLAKGGVFFLYTEYSGADAKTVKEVINKNLRRLRDHGLRKEELERAKSFTIGSYRLALQAPLHLIYELGRCQLLHGNTDTLQYYSREVKALTLDDIHEAARQLINPDRFTSVLVRSANELA